MGCLDALGGDFRRWDHFNRAEWLCILTFFPPIHNQIGQQKLVVVKSLDGR
jgi:hypothetical protein